MLDWLNMSLLEICLYVLTCICWIKVLCPTGKENRALLIMYIYTFIVISAYNRMILSGQYLSLIECCHGMCDGLAYYGAIRLFYT